MSLRKWKFGIWIWELNNWVGRLNWNVYYEKEVNFKYFGINKWWKVDWILDSDIMVLKI